VKSNSATRLEWLVLLGSLAVISVLRPFAADRFRKAKQGADVYPLPPPAEAVVASLGYRAACADAVFAYVLVQFGLHSGQRRRLEFAGEYVDTINALDPTFRDPYRFSEAFLVTTAPIKLEDWEKTREIYRRGLANRPYDTELWNAAGQFLAFLAPPYLPTPELKREYRLEGAKVMTRACELANDNVNIPYGCASAQSVFSDQGERQAGIDAALRLLEVTDDPEVEKLTIGYLRKKFDERTADDAERRKNLFRTAWMSDLPFVSKNKLLVVGPRVDALACAGLDRAEAPECAATWKTWARHTDKVRDLE
jgi:hypothetical protein